MVNANLYTDEQLREFAFSEDELKQLAKARKMPITFDDDCPETTPEMARRFQRVNPPHKLANV